MTLQSIQKECFAEGERFFADLITGLFAAKDEEARKNSIKNSEWSSIINFDTFHGVHREHQKNIS